MWESYCKVSALKRICIDFYNVDEIGSFGYSSFYNHITKKKKKNECLICRLDKTVI
jgi:anti-anti-sigma regulatory factor